MVEVELPPPDPVGIAFIDIEAPLGLPKVTAAEPDEALPPLYEDDLEEPASLELEEEKEELSPDP